MITKFKIFERHTDIDPYGEENWEEKKLFWLYRPDKTIRDKRFLEHIRLVTWRLGISFYVSYNSDKIGARELSPFGWMSKTEHGFDWYIENGYIFCGNLDEWLEKNEL